MTKETYENIGVVVGFIAFVIAWIYCIASYGFLLGVGLGWLPAAITAVVLGAAWPIVPFLLIWLTL